MVVQICASLFLGTIQLSEFPVGTYKADLSKAPRKTRGVLQAYFGQSYLAIQSDGTFEFCGIKQSGFWRKHKDRYIFVYDGFFNLKSSEPDAVLRKAWPTSHLEGFSLKVGQNGTLILAEFGAVKGPIIFNQFPKRSFESLIKIWSTLEETAEVDESYYAIKARLQSNWNEHLGFVSEPKNDRMLRASAANLLNGLKDQKGLEAVANLILSFPTTGTPGRDNRIRGILAHCIASSPSNVTATLLLEAHSKGLLMPKDVAPTLKKLARKQDVPILLGWLSSSDEYDKSESLEALAAIGATEALEPARKLVNDPKERVQVIATGIIAKLSADESERRDAIKRLAKWLRNSDFLIPFVAVEALRDSGHPLALTYLIEFVGSNLGGLARRDAATALGEIGDARAVPALIAAKTRSATPDDSWDDYQVQKAASEALYKFDQRRLQCQKFTGSVPQKPFN